MHEQLTRILRARTAKQNVDRLKDQVLLLLHALLLLLVPLQLVRSTRASTRDYSRSRRTAWAQAPRVSSDLLAVERSSETKLTFAMVKELEDGLQVLAGARDEQQEARS
eukprot:766244-Hanusia_phi.AAC.4